MSLVAVAQECTVTAEVFGHAPVPVDPVARLTLVPTGAGFRLNWKGLIVDLNWQEISMLRVLPLSGSDPNGVVYEASLARDGTLVLVGRPGGIEYGLIASCKTAPQPD